jgi:hypothetical protein
MVTLVAAIAIGILAGRAPDAGRAEAATTVFSVEPGEQNVALAAGSATVQVRIENATDVAAFEFILAYDPAVLSQPSVAVEPLINSTGRDAQCLGPIVDSAANGPGTVEYGCATTGSGAGVSGAGVLATVTFRLHGGGRSPVLLERVAASNELGDSTCGPGCLVEDGTVEVSGPAAGASGSSAVPGASGSSATPGAALPTPSRDPHAAPRASSNNPPPSQGQTAGGGTGNGAESSAGPGPSGQTLGAAGDQSAPSSAGPGPSGQTLGAAGDQSAPVHGGQAARSGQFGSGPPEAHGLLTSMALVIALLAASGGWLAGTGILWRRGLIARGPRPEGRSQDQGGS